VTALANYQRDIAKSSGKLAADWLQVNLNALVYEPNSHDAPRGTGCVYYGACRWGRRFAFSKYMTGYVTIAADPKVCDEFRQVGVDGAFVPRRIQWQAEGLSPWATSLYLEDSVTPDYSPYLSNRFYEALSYGLYPVFPVECARTVRLSGYDVPDALWVSDPRQIPVCQDYADAGVMAGWRRRATCEQQEVLALIRRTIRGG
jgi:hypothetical protein